MVWFNIEISSPNIFYLVGSAIYFCTYPILKYTLEKNNKKFDEYSDGRKYYILSNIMKSGVLSVISIIFLENIITNKINIIQTKNWEAQKNLFLKISALYTITDTVSLVVNREKMMWSTIIHHICVGLSYMYINNSNFSNEGIYKGFLIYGGFSSLAFLVNFYLGSRFIIKSETTKKRLKKISGYSYVLSCAGNWGWQIFYINKLLYHYYIHPQEVSLGKILGLGFYSTMLKYWIEDDLILMKHLLN